VRACKGSPWPFVSHAEKATRGATLMLIEVDKNPGMYLSDESNQFLLLCKRNDIEKIINRVLKSTLSEGSAVFFVICFVNQSFVNWKYGNKN